MKFLELRGKSLITIILMTSGLDFLLFGCKISMSILDIRAPSNDSTDDQGLFGGILGGERFKDTLGRPNPTMTGLVTAIYDIGCALGAVVAFVFGEKIGRKRSIILANLIVIIGAAIQTASFDYWQMFVARIIGGIGVGLSTVAVPILQSETLPAHNRGSLFIVQSALIIIGVAIASWLCFATLYADNSLQWRFPVACQILFSAIVLCLCPFLCETPRWLAQKGKIDEVCSILQHSDE
jgi:MFS family permease